MKRTLLTLTLTLVGLTGIGTGNALAKTSPPGGSGTSIATNVKACLNGGWQTKLNASNQHFANQQACILYALTGSSFGSITDSFSFTNFTGATAGSLSEGVLLSGQGSFLAACTQPLANILPSSFFQFVQSLPCGWANSGIQTVSPPGSTVSGSGTWAFLDLQNLTQVFGGTWAYGPHVTPTFNNQQFQTGEVAEGFRTATSGACHGATVRVVVLLVALRLTFGNAGSGGPSVLPALIAVEQTPVGNQIHFLTIGPEAALTPNKNSTFSIHC